jgi:hypothetical protein
MSRYYPIAWLNNTFKSQETTQKLLQPQLHNGILTEHDYQLAVKFLPGWHRYYDYAYALSSSFFTLSYGLHGPRLFANPRLFLQTPAMLLFPFTATSAPSPSPSATQSTAILRTRFKPYWRPLPIALSSIGALVLGAFVGQLHVLNSHLGFTLALENPAGFERAVRNVYDKVGGVGMSGPFQIDWIDPERPGELAEK